MRVQVNTETLEAVGEPEHVSVGLMADDFCIDEDAGVAYLTTHRKNTIDRISLDPARNNERFIVAKNPFSEELIGPCSGAWSRLPADYGKVAYFTCDGGDCPMVYDGQPRSYGRSSQRCPKRCGWGARRSSPLQIRVGGEMWPTTDGVNSLGELKIDTVSDNRGRTPLTGEIGGRS